MSAFSISYKLALNAWKGTPSTRESMDGSKIGVTPENNKYLENRIKMAYQDGFVEGYAAGRRAAIERLTEVINGDD